MVGIDEERIKEMADCQIRYNNWKRIFPKLSRASRILTLLSEKKGVSYKEDPRRMQLCVKIRDEAIVAEAHVRYEELKALMEIDAKATVRVYDTAICRCDGSSDGSICADDRFFKMH